MRTSIQNRHGAAFLLAIYFSAIVLLLLGGVSLQRTTVDARAAQVSRNLQQAFYLAESGLDQSLQHLRSGIPLTPQQRADELAALGGEYASWLAQPSSDLPDGIYGPYETPSGSYRFEVRTTKIEVSGSPDRTMRLTRTVTATGTSSGVPTSVTATFLTAQEPLSGMFANGWITVGDTLVKGSLHSGSGTPGSVFINDGVAKARIFGDVTVAPADETTPYSAIYGPAQQEGLSQNRPAPGLTAGIGIRSINYAQDPQDWSPRQVVLGEIGVAEIPRINNPITPETIPGEAKVLDLRDRRTLVITDGDPDWDLSNTAGALHNGRGTPDGLIILKLQYLRLGYESQLLTNAPTEIYVVGGDPSREASGYGGGYTAVHLAPESVLLASPGEPGRETTLVNGVEILVTTPATGDQAGDVLIEGPWAFFGSVWAPESFVSVAASKRWLRPYQTLMASIGDYNLESLFALIYDDPTMPGQRKGMLNEYVVANNLLSDTGCSALIVDEAMTRSRKTNSAPTPLEPSIISWTNSASSTISSASNAASP